MLNTPTRTTALMPFFSCSSDGTPLFAVRDGIAFEDALNQASCLMETAESLTARAAMAADTYEVWAAAYLVEMANAVISAAVAALNKERHHG